MFISVTRHGDRYRFSAGIDRDDPAGTAFSSHEDFWRSSWVRSDYGSFWEAHAAASKLVDDQPSHVMAKRFCFLKHADETEGAISVPPEDRMVEHYVAQYDIISRRLADADARRSMHDSEDPAKEAGAVRAELESLEGDIRAVMGMVDTPANKRQIEDILSGIAEALGKVGKGGDAEAKDSLRDLSSKAASAVAASRPTAFVRVGERLTDDGSYSVAVSEMANGAAEDIIRLSFGRDLVLDDVAPVGRLADESPYHSQDFFRRYWLPVVHAVGHVRDPAGRGVAVVDPSSPSGGLPVVVGGARTSRSVFCEESGGSWRVVTRSAASGLRESDLVPGESEVRCVNKALAAYYGRTGTVMESRPKRDYVEVKVDFKRGLGCVWLEGSDIEPVALPS